MKRFLLKVRDFVEKHEKVFRVLHYVILFLIPIVAGYFMLYCHVKETQRVPTDLEIQVCTSGGMMFGFVVLFIELIDSDRRFDKYAKSVEKELEKRFGNMVKE